ncbi:MAG: IS1595 family transposase [Proteobacteria bacterium]|nr:IS1595 family transposase [Pseudomonadota bacterium]
MLQTFKTFPEMLRAFPTEQSAIDHLTAVRWANGKFCPLCGNADEKRIGTLAGTNTHKCYVCRKRFSIKVGTIFQDTKLPLRTWYAAIWLITNHPKGIASTTLATDLGITQKSAWHVLHRLRHASRTPSFNAPLGGDAPVEADETFVGGLEKNKHADKRLKNNGGTGGKTIVMGLLERGGELRAGVIDNVQAGSLQDVVRHHVEPGSTLYTDDAYGYRGLAKDFDHHTVQHKAKRYVDGEAHTQSIEGVWALLKRQIIGIHHWVSPKHLDAYVSEMTFRYNRREMPKGERVNDLLSQVEGPLPYKVLIA